jgi:predicted signal transduction protein with EAL and GGDEF domain
MLEASKIYENDRNDLLHPADLTSVIDARSSGVEVWASNYTETTLLREQYRFLTRLVPILYVVVILTTATLTYGLRDAGPAWLQIWLPIGISCICLFRFNHWIKAREKVNDLDLSSIERDIRSTSILAPAITLGFTLVGIGLMHFGDHFQQSLAVTTIWLTAIASSFCLFVLPRTAVLVVLCASVPLCIEFLMEFNQLMTLIALLFMAIASYPFAVGRLALITPLEIAV